MFSIICKRDFKAFHSVRMPSGAFEKTHEHKWKIECKISAKELNNDGFVADFVIIDEKIDKIVSFLNNSNINQILNTKPASAENLAFYIFSKLEPVVNSDGIELKKVKVWEDENHGASYKP